MTEHGFAMGAVAVGASCIAIWSLSARRLASWNVSSAMAMVGLGLIVANEPLDLVDVAPTSETLRLIVELTLVLVLFSDASRVNLRGLRADTAIPARLLFIGLPLTIALGFGVAALLFDLDLWLCALLAAALAPTDAALGAPVVANRRVPIRIRRTLNVESGLNDGMVTPIVTYCTTAAVAEVGNLPDVSPGSALADLAVGAGIGIAVGVVGGWLLKIARDRSWTSPGATGVLIPVLAVLSYAAALHADGNGFVAAFVAGLAFGSTQRDAAEIGEFGERLGELFGLTVWLIVGVIAVGVLDGLTWAMAGFAVLALTLVRMIPVAIALTGTGLNRETVAFLGWFGPRGLASIVFGLIALDDLPAADGNTVITIVLLTVLLSVLLHGVSAGPLARIYGQHADRLGEAHPEHQVTGDHTVAVRNVAENPHG